METSYWVRRAGVPGFLGPMGLAVLRRAIEVGDISLHAEARAAAGDGKPEVLDGSGWIGVHELLGLAPPPPPTLPPPTRKLAQVRDDVRRNSAYRGVRKWLVLALAPAFGLALLPLVDIWSAMFGKGVDAPSLTIRLVGVTLVETLLGIAVPLLLWHLARALLDIADCHLLRRSERA